MHGEKIKTKYRKKNLTASILRGTREKRELQKNNNKIKQKKNMSTSCANRKEFSFPCVR